MCACVCTCVYLCVEHTYEHVLMKQEMKPKKCLSVSALCQVLYLIISHNKPSGQVLFIIIIITITPEETEVKKGKIILLSSSTK